MACAHIYLVWPESLLSARKNFGSLATNWLHSKDSDQTGQLPRLIWSLLGAYAILLVLSWAGSNLKYTCRNNLHLLKYRAHPGRARSLLSLVMLNKSKCHAHFCFSANQITWSRLLIQIHILSDKQCRFRSVGFFRSFRSQLIWIYTVCKGRVYPGSAEQGINIAHNDNKRTNHHREHACHKAKKSRATSSIFPN